MGAAEVFATACMVVRKVAGTRKIYEKCAVSIHLTPTEVGHREVRTADTPPIRKSAEERDEL